MKVINESGRWGIRAGYFSPALTRACRSVPGMTFHHETKTWMGDRTAVELVLTRLPVGLRVDKSALDAPVKVETGFLGPIATKGLREYQKEAVSFLLETKRAILADDMGLGKTCSSLTAARAVNGRTLVVCPSYVRGVWWNKATGGELKKWWPAAWPYLPAGIKATPIPEAPAWDTKVVVIHYDILHAWADAIRSWSPRTVIFDEAHALMNEGSRRSKAARAVVEGAEFVWGLSGTPMTNRPKDLWNVVDTISPGRFGNFFAFGLRYCDAHKEQVTPLKTVWKFDGASNLEELHGRLKGFMLRRIKSDVGLQLPPKTRQIVTVEVPAKARLMPGGGAKEMRASLDRAADAKVGDALAMVLAHVEEGHRVVAFTHRRSVAEFLAHGVREAGHPAELVHGGVSPMKRGAALERARGAKDGGLLAATIDSSSTGIDLSYADVAVFVELVWEPQELLQAEARLHRFGQKDPVLVQYIIAGGSTDELIANMVVSKLDKYETVIGKTGESLGDDLRGDEEDILGDLYAAIEKGKGKVA